MLFSPFSALIKGKYSVVGVVSLSHVRLFILGGSKITADSYCFQFPHLSVTVSTVPPSICDEVIAMILVF